MEATDRIEWHVCRKQRKRAWNGPFNRESEECEKTRASLPRTRTSPPLLLFLMRSAISCRDAVPYLSSPTGVSPRHPARLLVLRPSRFSYLFPLQHAAQLHTRALTFTCFTVFASLCERQGTDARWPLKTRHRGCIAIIHTELFLYFGKRSKPSLDSTPSRLLCPCNFPNGKIYSPLERLNRCQSTWHTGQSDLLEPHQHC